MRRDEEIYLRKQISYLSGKVEVYEALLYSNGILKSPEIINLDENGSNNE